MIDIKKKVEELFAAGVHLGHKKNKVHPKSKKYIYTFNQGVSIINLEKTAFLLEEAKKFVNNLKKEKKSILFVGTKKVASNILNNLCKKNNIPYISTKWPAGLITNFETIAKNIKKLKKLKEEKEKGEWKKFVKHEQLKFEKKLNKLEKFYGGIESLTKTPDAIFIIDIKKEKNALKEAVERKIPVIAIVDTNVNPEKVNYPIPGNDDSPSSIEYLVKEVVETYIK
ncbi:MAG: 30S ribosomal protein S2 [Patescibacteria group bacterium]|nr:MAG: 30S ribosomal protein S2 [Patescibacteria group bacterium]